MAEMAATFGAKFSEGESMAATFSEDATMGATFGEIQRVSTSNYEELSNKPSIENVVLIGNKTINQIGVGTATISEIESILYLD